MGDITLDRATSLDELERVGAGSRLISLSEAAAATLPVIVIDSRAATALGYGQRIAATGVGPAVAMYEGEAIAIVNRDDGNASPAIVFQARGA